MPKPVNDALDNLIDVKHNVLDHGYITLVDYMGTEACVANAARISYQKGTTQKNTDDKLLGYLISHQHWTPFETVSLKFQIKLPIFVARQWIRHRTAKLNEESARYSVLEDCYYVPKAIDIKQQSFFNKQGRDGQLTALEINAAQEMITSRSKISYSDYKFLLGENKEIFPGIARELARMVLPVNFYVSWVWKCDLRNLLHFLQLRMDYHAQYEIREYANKIAEIVQAGFPNIYKHFENYLLYATKLSAEQTKLLRALLDEVKQYVDLESIIPSMPENMSKRDYETFCNLL